MLVQAELAHDEREAAELAGVTWQPEISKMAQTLQRRDADEDSFIRLTRSRTNKTQVILPSAAGAQVETWGNCLHRLQANLKEPEFVCKW